MEEEKKKGRRSREEEGKTETGRREEGEGKKIAHLSVVSAIPSKAHQSKEQNEKGKRRKRRRGEGEGKKEMGRRWEGDRKETGGRRREEGDGKETGRRREEGGGKKENGRTGEEGEGKKEKGRRGLPGLPLQLRSSKYLPLCNRVLSGKEQPLLIKSLVWCFFVFVTAPYMATTGASSDESARFTKNETLVETSDESARFTKNETLVETSDESARFTKNGTFIENSDDYPRFMKNETLDSSTNKLTLESIRQYLIELEDTIIFNLIERAKFPLNSPTYDESSLKIPGFSGSLVQYIVKETEVLQAKVGRYESPEEQPFFPDDLPEPVVIPYNNPQELHPVGATININETIWKMYFGQLLPLFVAEGDDGNYGSTAVCDLNCLQALSRRIHYGKYVAEVKYRDARQDYVPLIHAQDRDALMKLLTFESVEEMVKRRVEKKAMVFGQDVSLDDKGNNWKYKIDPSILPRLYGEWVMPLTKDVEVEYLLWCLEK
ncbi:hypothetical protein NE237_028651 [Protea cynaroides]|uniref:chorismate mutase n=1 Tax=Protea cynaroides TaxID=273540 RepID=A0A9Q0GU85_9MAGN|nr:hypothetical protein NE237_028651 [Protea cynaroides]